LLLHMLQPHVTPPVQWVHVQLVQVHPPVQAVQFVHPPVQAVHVQFEHPAPQVPVQVQPQVTGFEVQGQVLMPAVHAEHPQPESLTTRHFGPSGNTLIIKSVTLNVPMMSSLS
jgi:hypothetical protein